MISRVLSIYESRADSSKIESKLIRKRINLFSFIRLFLFVLAIFLMAFWFNSHLALAISSSLSALVILVVFVRLSSNLSARQRMLDEIIRINEEESLVLDWKYDSFLSGHEYIDPEHPNTSDLDIFGKNSLFQFLNRTSITKGMDQLAAWLSTPSSVKQILSRQEAVEELALKLEWRQEFLATGRMSEETREDYLKLESWLNEKALITGSRFYRTLLQILPALTILSIALAFRWIPYNIPVFLFLVQLGLVGINLRRINHHHNQISRKFKLIDNFSSLIKLVEDEKFSCENLRNLQTGLSSSGIKASLQLGKLARIVVQFDGRLNMIMGFILNGLLMWDLLCILRLENWKDANAKEVPGWFNILGEFEALNSLGNFRFNSPGSVFPEICNDDLMVEAEFLGHPLIPEKENIRNDLKISRPGEFLLITGSNMAGKSTFLRSVGVNLILANAGAPVLARKMKWQALRVLTSMRVKDSLSSRESTFYAELKRLRMIIEVIKKGERIFVILDEILKGTNSRDKHFGSEMFIRQLIEEDCGGLIATHDLELNSLEKEFPEQVLNYCFEVQINKQEFIYDYKLRRGVCQTMNATELMKKMGISIDRK